MRTRNNTVRNYLQRLELSNRSVESVLCALLLFTATAAFAAAPAAQTKAAPQASANFEAEWSKLIAAAQQEGTLSRGCRGAPAPH